MGIVWIASYPKSGNTWVRFIAHHLLFGPAESSAVINERLPPIHRDTEFPATEGRTVCSKTHFVWTPDHPRASDTKGAIVIVRNPRDVALSALNYRRLRAVLPPGATDAQYLRAFIQNRGDDAFARQGFGTWAENVDSWVRARSFPTLVLRYEDMRTDPHAGARSIAAFLGIEADDDTIAEAVRSADLDRLRDMEHTERRSRSAGSIFRGRDANRSFMNRGATGHSLDDIEPGLDAAFDKAFGEDLARYGYARG